VAPAHEIAALGIDAEANEPLPARVIRRVASGSELARLSNGPAHGEGVCLDRLIFSAKEAVYKAWFGLAGRSLGFRDIELSIDVDRGAVRARLDAPAVALDGREVDTLEGRWCTRGALLCVAVVLPRRGERVRSDGARDAR
jgi:4'-phosphopantetheinyl transferase EntD